MKVDPYYSLPVEKMLIWHNVKSKIKINTTIKYF